MHRRGSAPLERVQTVRLDMVERYQNDKHKYLPKTLSAFYYPFVDFHVTGMTHTYIRGNKI